MKRFLAVLLLAPLSCFARAANYLTADPYPAGTDQPDQFEVTIDGAAAPVVSPAITNADGSRQLQLALDPLNLTVGSHTFSVIAVELSTSTIIGSRSPASSVTLKKTAVKSATGARAISK